jgi:hypothetical protein
MARRYDPPTYDLDPQQLQALDLLLLGKTINEAAAAVGVDRNTVSRWKRTDPGFIAAYNMALLSSWEASHKRLLDVRMKAIDKLEDLLDARDKSVALRAAAALVRIDIPKPTAHTDPGKVVLW